MGILVTFINSSFFYYFDIFYFLTCKHAHTLITLVNARNNKTSTIAFLFLNYSFLTHSLLILYSFFTHSLLVLYTPQVPHAMGGQVDINVLFLLPLLFLLFPAFPSMP